MRLFLDLPAKSSPDHQTDISFSFYLSRDPIIGCSMKSLGRSTEFILEVKDKVDLTHTFQPVLRKTPELSYASSPHKLLRKSSSSIQTALPHQIVSHLRVQSPQASILIEASHHRKSSEAHILSNSLNGIHFSCPSV